MPWSGLIVLPKSPAAAELLTLQTTRKSVERTPQNGGFRVGFPIKPTKRRYPQKKTDSYRSFYEPLPAVYSSEE